MPKDFRQDFGNVRSTGKVCPMGCLPLLNISKKQSLILSQELADHAANVKYFL
jgi:hypothetical protein